MHSNTETYWGSIDRYASRLPKTTIEIICYVSQCRWALLSWLLLAFAHHSTAHGSW